MSDKPITASDGLEDASSSGASPAPEKLTKPVTPRKRKPAKPKRKAAAKRKSTMPATAIAPRPAGRPPYEPTNENAAKIRMLAGLGVNVPDIGRWLGIGETTLRKYHSPDLMAGAVEANAKVAVSLFTAATNKEKPNVTAMIFWLKARAGWKEDPGRELIPPPAPMADPKTEAPGKKEAANAAALTAEIGSDWEQLLGSPGPVGMQ